MRVREELRVHSISDILKWKWGSAVFSESIPWSKERQWMPHSSVHTECPHWWAEGLAPRSKSTISYMRDYSVSAFCFHLQFPRSLSALIPQHHFSWSPTLSPLRGVLFSTLPSQTAECVRQALHPFQHAVQFVRLLLQKLHSFHFNPEHSPHSSL